MLRLRFSGMLVLAVGLAAIAQAGPVYIEDNTGNLGTITVAGAYTNIGVTQFAAGAGPVVMGDIAVNTAGQLYGISFDANATTLYSISTVNGLITQIGATGAGPSADAGLTFSQNGTLYGNDGTTLVSISTVTGLETPIGNMGVATDGDFAFDNTGTLYMTGGGGNLYTINTATGAAALVGGLGVGGMFGLAYTNGGLYGFGFNNMVYSINQGNGLATAVANFAGLPGGWGGTFGADTAPAAVPEPFTFALAASGVALAIKRRKSRRA